ncbi:MAG: BglII/BstYI family type II restriction endonuclease [Glycocaulis sp.]
MTDDFDNDDWGKPDDDVDLAPNEAADPQWLIEKKIPADLREKYEVHSYRSAATILSESFPDEFTELCEMLRRFEITTSIIRTAGGNESDVPKLVSSMLRPKGWNETAIQGDLLVKLRSKALIGHTPKGKPKYDPIEREIVRQKYLDGHKVDYVKHRVAFDLEWNSKDQTFDRDLYAFSAFAQCGVIDVGVLVTRSTDLGDLIRQLGPALTKNGEVELTKDGNPRPTHAKYGASTTWMGKLLYRLNAGRNGACPVLVFGIGPNCVTDWPLEPN